MNCDHAIKYVEAYADAEVRGPRRLLLRRHLHSCAACGARLDEVRALRQRIRSECVRFAAPSSVRARAIALRAPQEDATPALQRRGRWTWAGAGALAGSLATILLFVTVNSILDRRDQQDVALALVDAHVRATLNREEIQVASSDQHTVKPWLSARLGYSPPVRDLAGAGYPLIGARIERVDDHDVAVLVYRYRLHGVDVYVTPQRRAVGTSDGPRTIRGFNVLHVAGHDMDWVAVSDASFEALAPLLRELAGTDPRR